MKKLINLFLSFTIVLISLPINIANASTDDLGVDLIPICKDTTNNSLDLGLYIFYLNTIGDNTIDSLVLEIKEPTETTDVSAPYNEGAVFYKPVVVEKRGKYIVTTTLYNLPLDSTFTDIGVLRLSLDLVELSDHAVTYEVDLKVTGPDAEVIEFKDLDLDIKIADITECDDSGGDDDDDDGGMGVYYGDRNKVKRKHEISELEKCYIRASNDESVASDEFSDISTTDSSWLKESIGRLRKCEIVIGYEDGSYKPWQNVNRAEMTKMVINMANARERLFPVGSDEMPFTDVARDTWWYVYIATAYKYDVVKGYSDNTFKPFDTITRQEALKIILGVFGFNPDEYTPSNTNTFDDLTVGHWSEKYIAYAKEKGVISGYGDNTFKPLNYISRAEISKILMNIVDVLDAEAL